MGMEATAFAHLPLCFAVQCHVVTTKRTETQGHTSPLQKPYPDPKLNPKHYIQTLNLSIDPKALSITLNPTPIPKPYH